MIGFGIFMAAWPDNPLVHIGPAWFQNLNPTDPSKNLLYLIPGAIAILLGAVVIYDNKPIPDEFVPPPEMPTIEQGEAWRPATGFRYLEKLKQQVLALEKEMRRSHEEATAAHRRLPESSGFIEYKQLRRTVGHHAEYILEADEELKQSKEHIAKVFAGDVRTDVLEIEEQIEKLQRLREKYESEARIAEREITNARDKSHRGYHQNELESLGNWIHATDTDLIALRSSLKELREFDFKRLYGELGVSPETMRVDTAQLNEIKTKAKIVSEIRPQTSTSSKTEDEKKMDAAGQRIKYDIKFNVEQRLGRRLNTLQEIQRFFRERSDEIKQNPTLSYDEKTEQLDQLTRDCEEYKKELRTNVNVYEED
jgi:hypothetical protein